MVAGFDGYFQIARCFRDEDQRADRQLEFSQIDLEMSFVGIDEILHVLEEITVQAFRDVRGIELPRPFPRASYAEVMARYGSDRPDTRIALELVDLTDLVANSAFQVFTQAVQAGGVVRALPIPDAQAVSRSELDRLVDQSRQWGAQGMAWVRVTPDGAWQSPITRYLSETEQRRLPPAPATPWASVTFIADRPALASDILGRLRVQLGERLERRADRPVGPAVVDFHCLKRPERPAHHMHYAVALLEEDIGLLSTQPRQARDALRSGAQQLVPSPRNHRARAITNSRNSRLQRGAGARVSGLCSSPRHRRAAPWGLCSVSTDSASCWPVVTVCATSLPSQDPARRIRMQSPNTVEPEQLRELVRVR
jgi:aspartyl-tRNA synthetase